VLAPSPSQPLRQAQETRPGAFLNPPGSPNGSRQAAASSLTTKSRSCSRAAIQRCVKPSWHRSLPGKMDGVPASCCARPDAGPPPGYAARCCSHTSCTVTPGRRTSRWMSASQARAHSLLKRSELCRLQDQPTDACPRPQIDPPGMGDRHQSEQLIDIIQDAQCAWLQHASQENVRTRQRRSPRGGGGR
jgi:hypothetical protein